MAQVKPIIHGRDHLPGGADPPCPNGIDSTDNVGINCGVRSFGPETEGYVLTADGDGGSVWAAASGTANPEFGYYTGTPTSVSAGSNYSDTIVYHAGAALLDLTTPDQPAIIVRGVYSIHGIVTNSSAWNVNNTLIGKITTTISPPGVFYGADNYASADNTGILWNFSVTMLAQMEAGTVLTFLLNNRDSVSRVVSFGAIYVQKILEY